MVCTNYTILRYGDYVIMIYNILYYIFIIIYTASSGADMYLIWGGKV